MAHQPKFFTEDSSNCPITNVHLLQNGFPMPDSSPCVEIFDQKGTFKLRYKGGFCKSPNHENQLTYEIESNSWIVYDTQTFSVEVSSEATK